MKVTDMVYYFAKKNKIQKKDLLKVIKDINIMKKKGISDFRIFMHIPDWGKKVL